MANRPADFFGISPLTVAPLIQTVIGLDTTGNIMGFDISKTGANQVTVTKGSCLDSTLEVPMALTVDTALAIPAVANTIYHIFLVRLVSNGTFTVKAYTTEAGVASDALVDKWRWIGFWRTNGSSNCMEGLQVDGTMAFLKPSETVIASAFAATTFTLLTLTGMIPVSRVTEIYPGIVSSAVESYGVVWSYDGVNASTYTYTNSAINDTSRPWGLGTNGFALRQIPIKNGVLYAKIDSGGSANLGIAQIRLRR